MKRSVREVDPDGDTLLILRNPDAAFAVLDFGALWPNLLPTHIPPKMNITEIQLGVSERSLRKQQNQIQQNEEELRLRLSSTHLTFASAYFKAMLTNNWRETRPEEGYSFVVTAEEWDQKALLILMNIIHGQTTKIPRIMGIEMLAKMAVLVDYYKCHEAVEFYAKTWINNLIEPLPTCYGRTFLLRLCISWVFSESEVFRELTRAALYQSRGPIHSLGLPIPGDVIDALEMKRQNFISKVISELHDLKSRLCKDKGHKDKGACSFECSSILLGALIKGMNSIRILDDPPPELLEGYSIMALEKAVLSIQEPNYSSMPDSYSLCTGETHTRVNKLKIRRKIYIGFGDDDIPDEVPSRPSDNLATESHDTPHCPDEVPFRPPGNLAAKLHDTPRYLFRVFSNASAGENSSECMKSVDALDNTFEDIFARDPFTVALTLNEHLRWQPKSYGDPFISWTTSLLVAIQYAIYKHKKQSTKLSAISLCIVDTTLFPDGVFMKDIDLMNEFHDKVPDHYLVIDNEGCPPTWGNRGLDNFRKMRNKQHKTYSGVYYFGEYLSQGQTNIEGRSCTVTCDKIINSNLFAFMPQFEDELKDKSLLWANAVIKLRQPFYTTEQEEMNNSDFSEATIIALEFDTAWFLPMLANLLALNPRTARDPRIIGWTWEHFREEVMHHLSPKVTNVVANDNIPEVFHFGKIIHDIIRHFIRESGTPGGRKMFGPGDLAWYLPTVDHDYVQPLMQSLETLRGTIQELQEDTT
ncbi:hypothetical protein T069G_07512 [Trichoderma breve]|uniref:DUF7587 domain-containing protein n=1 Tax=Trichoderma breve TaxID=2034170 RepID=A0A9W9BF81_9HYPO|nr:hypothetical protein T069G_07512 [Trichoderma breve]KAJ4859245.1 hypothetical protein T069G_07512 [Trichoderma breve]